MLKLLIMWYTQYVKKKHPERAGINSSTLEASTAALGMSSWEWYETINSLPKNVVLHKKKSLGELFAREKFYDSQSNMISCKRKFYDHNSYQL